MNTRLLTLLPRDGYFFKDGRGWSGGVDAGGGRGTALEWPFPSTLRGALRTAYGLARSESENRAWTPEDWRDRTHELAVSSVLALRRPFGRAWTQADRVWPAPADALYLRDESDVQALDPRPLPTGVRTLGRDDDHAREALWWPWQEQATGKPEPGPRYWSEADFAAWLAVARLRKPAPADRLRLPARLEVHLAVQPATQTAEDSMLYLTPRTETLEGRPAHEWGMALRALLPVDWSARAVPLGADRRPAWSEAAPGELFDPPQGLAQSWSAPSRGLRLVVVTPGEFQGWLPPGFTAHGSEYRGELPGCRGDFVLRAAFVPRAVSVSGWDMAGAKGRGCPKPLRRLVPPGATYFLVRRSGDGVTWDEARELWLAQLGSSREDGMGCVVPGRWNPEPGS